MGKLTGIILKSLFSAIILSTTLVGQVTQADIRFDDRTDPYRPPRYPDPYPENPYDPYQPQEPAIIETLYVGRDIRNQVIPFGEMLDLDRQYEGYEIASVEVIASALNSNARLELVIDGNVEDREYYPEGQVELHPYMNRILGYEAHQVELSVLGRVRIEEIRVHLVQGEFNPYPPEPIGNDMVIERQIRQDIFSYGRIDLGQVIGGLGQYRGYRVEQIIVNMEATNNYADADVLVNSFSTQRQSLSAYARDHSFFISGGSNEIGRGADSIVLVVNGNARVHSVRLVLSR